MYDLVCMYIYIIKSEKERWCWAFINFRGLRTDSKDFPSQPEVCLVASQHIPNINWGAPDNWACLPRLAQGKPCHLKDSPNRMVLAAIKPCTARSGMSPTSPSNWHPPLRRDASQAHSSYCGISTLMICGTSKGGTCYLRKARLVPLVAVSTQRKTMMKLNDKPTIPIRMHYWV